MSAIDPKVDELLSLMQEEAAEIIQIISKIRRFGFDSYHPEDAKRITNQTLLTNELADLWTLVQLYSSNTDRIDWRLFNSFMAIKYEKLKKYTTLFSD